MSIFSTEQIEQYLKGEMNESDQTAFEALMEKDADFRQEVEDHRLILDGLKGIQMEHFKSEVDQWEMEISENEKANIDSPNSDKIADASASKQNKPTPLKNLNQQKTTPHPINWKIFAAAAAILFLIFAIPYFWAVQNYSSAALALTEYVQPVLPGPRSGGTFDNLLSEGVDAMKVRDYSKAIDRFKSIPSNALEYIEAQFYLGHSQFSQNQPEEAILSFQNVADSKDSRFAAEAEWVLALCHLKKGDKTSTLSVLQTIIDQAEHDYAEKAAGLKTDVESFWFGVVN